MDHRPVERLETLTKDIRAAHKVKSQALLPWRWQRVLVLLLSDILALAIAWQIARYLNQFYSPIPAQLVWWVWFGLPSLFWIFVASTLVLFARNGLYGASTQARNYVRAGQLVSVVYWLSLVVGYFYDPKLDPPRSLFFTAWFCSIALMIAARLMANLALRQFEQAQTRTTVFLIAPANRLKRLSEILAQRSHYQIVGAALSSMANSPAIFQAILESKAQEVLAQDLPQVELASSMYWKLRGAGIALRLMPSSREMLYRRGIPEIFAGLPTLRIAAPLIGGLDYRAKRWLDFIGAAFGVIVLFPLFLALAIAIKLSSPGPVLFRQERMGLHGRIFQVWKFRTMVANAPDLQASLENRNETHDGIMFKIKHDPRVTPLGNFLRRTSLDELPQLFNVLLGQMSLVGPRPLPLRDIVQFNPWHHIRHQVLPGITGLWQISGRSDIGNFDDAARLDLYYIDNWSLNLDLEILLETVRMLLFGKGAY